MSLKSCNKITEDIKLENIFGNVNNIHIILDYLKYSDDKKAIILRGSVGSGKMTLLKACINELNYDCFVYDIDCENDEILENMKMSICAKGMNKLFGLKEKVVIIRDIDNSLKTSQKAELFAFLSKCNNSSHVIMTSSDKTVGILRAVPVCIQQLNFEIPNIDDIVTYFSTNSLTKKELEDIIIKSNYDLRYIKLTIENINLSTLDMKDILIKNSKFIELSTFDSIKFCSVKNSWNDKLIHSSTYTNFTVFHNYPNMTTDIKNLSYVSDMNCDSDILLCYAFSNNAWMYTDEMSYIMGTIGPLEFLKRNKPISIKKSKNKLSNIVCRNIYDNLEYPSSNISMCLTDQDSNELCEMDYFYLKIIMIKYFGNMTFSGNTKEFQNDMKDIKCDPIKSYKLCFMMEEPKKYKKMLKEFKLALKKYIN
jgi:hypothetical protein